MELKLGGPRWGSRHRTGASPATAAADSYSPADAAISGTANAFGNAAAPDGIVFGGPEIVFGPAAIHDLFDAQRGTSLSWHPLYSRAAESGDLGFSIGESIATSRGQSGAAVQRFGKYLTIWRKEPNGDWKYVIDGGNARPSPVGARSVEQSRLHRQRPGDEKGGNWPRGSDEDSPHREQLGASHEVGVDDPADRRIDV